MTGPAGCISQGGVEGHPPLLKVPLEVFKAFYRALLCHLQVTARMYELIQGSCSLIIWAALVWTPDGHKLGYSGYTRDKKM